LKKEDSVAVKKATKLFISIGNSLERAKQAMLIALEGYRLSSWQWLSNPVCFAYWVVA